MYSVVPSSCGNSINRGSFEEYIKNNIKHTEIAEAEFGDKGMIYV